MLRLTRRDADSHQSSHPILSMVATPERSDARAPCCRTTRPASPMPRSGVTILPREARLSAAIMPWFRRRRNRRTDARRDGGSGASSRPGAAAIPGTGGTRSDSSSRRDASRAIPPTAASASCRGRTGLSRPSPSPPPANPKPGISDRAPPPGSAPPSAVQDRNGSRSRGRCGPRRNETARIFFTFLIANLPRAIASPSDHSRKIREVGRHPQSHLNLPPRRGGYFREIPQRELETWLREPG